jgi:hypothetical protein
MVQLWGLMRELHGLIVVLGVARGLFARHAEAPLDRDSLLPPEVLSGLTELSPREAVPRLLAHSEVHDADVRRVHLQAAGGVAHVVEYAVVRLPALQTRHTRQQATRYISDKF